MARATLKISADGSSVERVFKRIPVLAEQSAAAMQKAFATAHKKSVQDWEAWAREVERAMQRAQKAVSASVIRQQRDTERASNDAVKLEREKTRVTEAESAKRARAPYREADENEKAKRRELTIEERVEREKTRIVQREANARARAIAQAERAIETGAVWHARPSNDTGPGDGGGGGGRRRGVPWGAAAIGAGRIAFDSMRTMHAQIQSEREARAQTERSLNDALVQTVPSGATVDEIARHRRTIFAFAREHGIREEELTPAITDPQGRFATISSGATEADRAENLRGLLGAARIGRMTGNNLQDTTNFFGAIRAMPGMDAQTALNLTRQSAAAAFMGSVSLGEASAQGLPSMLQTVASRTAGMPAEQRAAASSEAIRSFFADMQIQAAVGQRVGASGVREVGLETRLHNTPMMTMLRRRLLENFHGNRAAEERIGQMFNVDRHGNASLQEDIAGDPARFGMHMAQLFNGDPNQMRNVLGAHGRWSRGAGGAQMLFGAPQMTAMANMLAIGPDALAQRDRIMHADLSPEQMRTIEAVRAGEDDTELARNQQTQRDALRDNTSALVRFSDRMENLMARNPLATTAASGIGSGISAGIGGLMAMRGAAGAATAASAANAAAGGGAAAAATGGLGLMGGLAVGAAGAAGIAGGSFIRDMIDRHTNGGYAADPRHRGNDGGWSLTDLLTGQAFQGRADTADADPSAGIMSWAQKGRQNTSREGGKGMSAAEYAQALVQALQNTRINVVMDTHQLALAAAQSASATNSPPPEARR